MEEKEVALQQKAFKLPGRNQVRDTSFRIIFLNLLVLLSLLLVSVTQHMLTLGAQEAMWFPKAIWLLISQTPFWASTSHFLATVLSHAPHRPLDPSA